jgi:hypothetical protein
MHSASLAHLAHPMIHSRQIGQIWPAGGMIYCHHSGWPYPVWEDSVATPPGIWHSGSAVQRVGSSVFATCDTNNWNKWHGMLYMLAWSIRGGFTAWGARHSDAGRLLK